MWSNNIRVFYQKPDHEQPNLNRARNVEVWPAVTASGEPGAFITGKQVHLFLPAQQAERIRADIGDALTTATDLLTPVHTSRSTSGTNTSTTR